MLVGEEEKKCRSVAFTTRDNASDCFANFFDKWRKAVIYKSMLSRMVYERQDKFLSRRQIRCQTNRALASRSRRGKTCSLFYIYPLLISSNLSSSQRISSRFFDTREITRGPIRVVRFSIERHQASSAAE